MSNEYEPVLVKIGDKEIEFLRLDVDDLERWAGQVKAKNRVDEETRVRADPTLRNNLDLQQQFIREASQKDVTFGDLWKRTFTPPGARKALAESLKKGGKSDGEAVALIKSMHWTRMSALAQEVMSPPAPEVLEGENGGPPAEGEGQKSPDEGTDL